MKKISTTTKATTLTVLLLVILFIFTKKKKWNYKKVQSVEYNKEYNEKHPVIDTVTPLYKNANRIFIRRFEIGGHSVIGEINGGSKTVIIHDFPNCGKCKDFFLSLHSGRKH